MWTFWTSFWCGLYLVGSIILFVIGSPICVCVSWTLTVAPVPTLCCSAMGLSTFCKHCYIIIIGYDCQSCCGRLDMYMPVYMHDLAGMMVLPICPFLRIFVYHVFSVIQVNVIFTIWNDFSCHAFSPYCFRLDGLYVKLWQALDVSCLLS